MGRARRRRKGKKVNHKDYIFDHIAWGVEVMKRVNSPRVRILYDIYHAQIMDGDIVRNIRDNFQWIGHFHTGGNPGRHEIDETQELNYRFIAKAIADLGFTGFITHEYSPSQGHDPIVELEKAIEICDQ
jgi:hydroxypyruvate isomerase